MSLTRHETYILPKKKPKQTSQNWTWLELIHSSGSIPGNKQTNKIILNFNLRWRCLLINSGLPQMFSGHLETHCVPALTFFSAPKGSAKGKNLLADYLGAVLAIWAAKFLWPAHSLGQWLLKAFQINPPGPASIRLFWLFVFSHLFSSVTGKPFKWVK